jgi:hypothetical protein
VRSTKSAAVVAALLLVAAIGASLAAAAAGAGVLGLTDTTPTPEPSPTTTTSRAATTPTPTPDPAPKPAPKPTPKPTPPPTSAPATPRTTPVYAPAPKPTLTRPTVSHSRPVVHHKKLKRPAKKAVVQPLATSTPRIPWEDRHPAVRAIPAGPPLVAAVSTHPGSASSGRPSAAAYSGLWLLGCLVLGAFVVVLVGRRPKAPPPPAAPPVPTSLAPERLSQIQS